ncbi:phage holin family protein [Marivita sp.]|uniref:phage holin family protein n=1 Tax=Marivita sp. TaxID=2003365 RepID=UPI003F6C28CD
MENLILAFLRSQFGDVRRKTRGALLEAAALGMIGLATALLFLSLFLWLSSVMEPWQAAALLSCVGFIVAALLMLFGRTLMRPNEPDPHDQAIAALKALGLMPQGTLKDTENAHGKPEQGIGLVAAALAAGLMLGRSTKR